MFSSKKDESFSLIIFQYVAALFPGNSNRARRLLSLSLNRSFFRLVSYGGAFITGDAVYMYSTIVKKLSIEQKRLLAHSGAWPVLITLVKHENHKVVSTAVKAMRHLISDREGEDYARFIEEDLFCPLMKCLSSRITDISDVVISVARDFPLPTCCASLVSFLNESLQAEPSLDEEDALKLLASFARCRGLAPSSFALTLGTLLPL
jgi:hypothetical protein